MKNLFILIFRLLLKQKRSFLFSLVGLSTGLALAIMSLAYLANEYSCDRHNPEAHNIFRITDTKNKKAWLDEKYYATLTSSVPGIESACRVYSSGALISVGQNAFENQELAIVDSAFFNFFYYKIDGGSGNSLLNAPNKIILSDHLAQKLFGTENPVGKMVKINMQINAEVTGVYQKSPNKQHLNADAIVSYYTQNVPYTGGHYWSNKGAWNIKLSSFYVKLGPNADTSSVNKILNQTYFAPWESEIPQLKLQPFLQIYWNNSIDDSFIHGNKALLTLLISITLIVLIIAGINYINLSLSNLRAESKITSVLKVHGAKPLNILLFYAGSAIIVLLAAFMVAIFLTWLVLPVFNLLLLTNINVSILFSLNYLLVFISVIAIIFCFIGLYPAILFSGINPIQLMHGNLSSKLRLNAFSKAMLVFQFFITIVLVNAVFLIYKQLAYLENKNPGFESDNILHQKIHYSINNETTILSYIEELKKHPGIINCASSTGVPFNIFMYSGQQVNGVDVSFNHINCDTSFLNFLGIKIIEGRNFLPSEAHCCIITQKLANDCGFDNALNQKIGNKTVIGVVNSIYGENYYQNMRGILFELQGSNPQNLLIKTNGTNMPQTLKFIKSQWQKFFPEYPLEIMPYRQLINKPYENEQQLAKSISIIAALAIFLCCLGLIGVVANMAQSREKEIGIRKANGATTFEIIYLLNTEFVMWIALAMAAAMPIAYYILNKWLENFAYRTHFSWWIFALSGLAAIMVASAAITWQSWQSARRNPIESLRYE